MLFVEAYVHNVCVNVSLTEIFNVEVLVQCIRSSTSPQTQRQALLLMASVAHLLPVSTKHRT